MDDHGRNPSSDQPILYVLDTNVLIHDPNALLNFEEHHVAIPMIVLEELDKLKSGHHSVAAECRQAIRLIDKTLGEASPENVELGVPIQLQVGQSMVYSKEAPMRSVGRPITLDGVACDFPELKIVGIHVGIPWTDEMIAMAWKHENVFIGSDAHSPKYWPESLVKYINSYGQDKVLFGTDFPVLGFRRTMDEVLDLNLRPDPLRKFLRDNALRVYNLKA